MTLNTNIWIHNPLDAEEFFSWVNANVLRVTDPIINRHVPGDTYYGDVKYTDYGIANRLGQGFDAIFDLEHNKGQEIDPKADYLAQTPEADRDEDDLDYYGRMPKYFIKISFDTAYGYHKTLGETTLDCSMLHAIFIRQIHDHLAEQGATLSWQNEYTGEIFQGLDGLETLVSSGVEAGEWFDNLVMPAIRAKVASEGGTLS